MKDSTFGHRSFLWVIVIPKPLTVKIDAFCPLSIEHLFSQTSCRDIVVYTLLLDRYIWIEEKKKKKKKEYKEDTRAWVVTTLLLL